MPVLIRFWAIRKLGKINGKDTAKTIVKSSVKFMACLAYLLSLSLFSLALALIKLLLRSHLHFARITSLVAANDL